jgi:hypothetical protein
MAPPRKKGMSPNTLLGVGLAACAALVVIALVASRFLASEPPPPPPPPPPATATTVTGVLRYTEGYYKAELDEDAKKLGLKASPDLAAMAKPLPYFDESGAARRMKPERDTLETPHLRLTTKVSKEWAMTPGGQGFRYEHIILTITNRGDRPLAFHIATSLGKSGRCREKGHMLHNALALRAGQTESRTECLWAPGSYLTVEKIEVIELGELGYHYVSRLPPTQVLLDERTAGGHEPPKEDKTCSFVPWREVQAARSEGGGWADVIDFYARHNCEEYSFWRGYRRWTSPGTLPSHPVAGEPPPPPATAGGQIR